MMLKLNRVSGYGQVPLRIEVSEIESYRSYDHNVDFGSRQAQTVIRTKSGQTICVVESVYEIDAMMEASK